MLQRLAAQGAVRWCVLPGAFRLVPAPHSSMETSCVFSTQGEASAGRWLASSSVHASFQSNGAPCFFIRGRVGTPFTQKRVDSARCFVLLPTERAAPVLLLQGYA